VFENRVLRRIFGPRRDEIGGWRKLHSEELHNMFSLPSIIRMIKSGRMRWTWHVHAMYSILVGKPEGKRPFCRRRLDWKATLKWILERWDGDMD
jgi:hypothetical protein